MCHSHPLSPEKALLLESTLNAEETDLATLQALLDQVEGDHAAPWSPHQGWRQFRNAHRDRFPAPLPRQAILWAAALGAAACVGLPLVLDSAETSRPATPAPTGSVSGWSSSVTPLGNGPYQPDRPDLSWLSDAAVPAGQLPSLRGLVAMTQPRLRAQLPPDARLFRGPVSLPHDAQLEEGPWYPPKEEDVPLTLQTEDGTELEIRNFVQLP